MRIGIRRWLRPLAFAWGVPALLAYVAVAGESAPAGEAGAPRAKEAPRKVVRPQVKVPGAATPPKVEVAPPRRTYKRPPTDPRAEAVIARYVKAIGGLEALADLVDYHEKFKTIIHSPTGQTSAVMERWLRRPEGDTSAFVQIREAWLIEGAEVVGLPISFVQIWDGTEGWVEMFGEVQELEGQNLYSLVWDKFIDDFFVHWTADGYAATYIGAGEVDGKPVEVIELYNFAGQSIGRHLFDRESGLLVKREWTGAASEGGMKKEVYIKEYRELKNPTGPGKPVLHSFTEEVYEGGDLTSERKILELRINSGLGDELFAKPKGKPFRPRIFDKKAADGKKAAEEKQAVEEKPKSLQERLRELRDAKKKAEKEGEPEPETK